MRKLKKIEKQILNIIGYSVVKYYENSDPNIYEFLIKLNVHHIRYRWGKLQLGLERPGLLIGKKGELIDFIKNEIMSKLSIKKLFIKIEEMDINCHLIPLFFGEIS